MTNSCGTNQNLYIEPTGKIFPCYACKTPDVYFGNIFSQNVCDILRSHLATTIYEYTVDENDQCKSCPARYLCRRGCKAWNQTDEPIEIRNNINQNLLRYPPDYCNSHDSYNYIKARNMLYHALQFLNAPAEIFEWLKMDVF